MKDPVLVDLIQGSRVPSTVTHYGIMMRPGESFFKAVGDLMVTRKPERAMVFCNSKAEVFSFFFSSPLPQAFD